VKVVHLIWGINADLGLALVVVASKRLLLPPEPSPRPVDSSKLARPVSDSTTSRSRQHCGESWCGGALWELDPIDPDTLEVTPHQRILQPEKL
jgi:hypothetical protein